MGIKRAFIVSIFAASLIGLTGCNLSQLNSPQPATPLDPSETEVTQQAEISLKMARYLQRVQENLLVRGLLRTDGGGPDVPFNQRNLVDNFIRIALYDEYISRGGRLVAKQTVSRLRRWEQPILMQVQFGPSVPLSQRRKDRASIRAYTRRLSRLTGIPIKMVLTDANYHVLILNEDERRAAAPLLHEIVPGISPMSIYTITDMNRSTLCLVFAFSSSPKSAKYAKAVAVIRAEHPDLLRQSCIHEELAQGMGLANDSPAARPSIFNDDEEFGLLTGHDELLLKLLYDRRLSTGMSINQARPIVKEIAAELLGGQS